MCPLICAPPSYWIHTVQRKDPSITPELILTMTMSRAGARPGLQQSVRGAPGAGDTCLIEGVCRRIQQICVFSPMHLFSRCGLAEISHLKMINVSLQELPNVNSSLGFKPLPCEPHFLEDRC